MKKSFVGTFLFSCLCVFAANAENAYRPYAGVDFLYNKAKTNLTRSGQYGALLNLGTTYNKYFGTEIFYQQTASKAKTIGTNTKYKTSYRAYGLDMIVTMPVCAKADVNLSLGAATYVLREKLTGKRHGSDEGFGYRFGAGAVYHLTDRLAARFNARYINFDHISNLKHASEYTLGVRYYFREN